jgi:DNA-directed RNA polymerase I subunit RPA49
MSASDPSEVYSRKTIIPDDEWALISTSEILKATGDRERMALMPYRSSRWIEEKLRVAIEGSDGAKRKTSVYVATLLYDILTVRKLLYYISCMRSVMKNDRSLSSIDSATLASKFNNMPKLILDSLIKRFAETSGSKTSLTTASKTKLMSYMFALMLMVENFVIDTQKVADDLSMPSTK